MSAQTVVNDRYELNRMPIARGGMGEVWEGRDTKLDREVAVKFIRFPDGVRDDDLVRRFVRESRITARLQHPGVPAVFDVGTHEGRPFLVMQRVHGISIADLIAGHGKLPIGWAAAIAAQTCAVLAVAHAASLIHRDLKPANLMLEPDGTVKVLDFGLAVAIDLADYSQITRSGQTIGTPAYMAPEQVLAAMSGPQSDLYTLGCTLYEMLAGAQLFSGSTAYAVMNKQVDERPSLVRDVRPEVPSELAALIGALLEKKPEDRPATAHDVYDALLPHVTDLGPLPGVLNPPAEPSPVRMYSAVVSRAFGPAESAVRVDPAAPKRVDIPPPAEPARAARRDDIEVARAEASTLVRQSRYSQAAELLGDTVAAAGDTFGERDPDVLNLRLEWANVLFEGGDYRQAAPAYQRLTLDLADRDGPDSELAFRCRVQDATCQAAIGETARALEKLGRLVDDEQRVFGKLDPRPLELRRQIGVLQLGAGQRDTATVTLRALLDDLLGAHGEDHPAVPKIRALLESAGT